MFCVKESNTKVAIPQLGDAVAPCFEAARSFLIAEIQDGVIGRSHVIVAEAPEGYRKVRLLRVHQPDCLICNGIKTIYCDMLTASGVKVIQGVGMLVETALSKFAMGKLTPSTFVPVDRAQPEPTDRAKLIAWTKEHFENTGYTVSPGPGEDCFLIDLIAEIKCPVCSKTVTVAICCGAHTYRTTQEIVEFYYATSSGYNARVFVWPSIPEVRLCCGEYGIELIDPELYETTRPQETANRLPLLKGLVAGHERASGPLTAGQ